MEQTKLALETIVEVVRVKQEVMERPVEYKTGMVSSEYGDQFRPVMQNIRSPNAGKKSTKCDNNHPNR